MLKLLFFFIFTIGFVFAQQSVGQFHNFNSPRLARSLALGNSYTGVAEGIETIHYNDAGLATSSEVSFYYSNGEGWPITKELNSHNFGVLVPFFGTQGAIAFSANTLGIDDPEFKYSIYQIHAGKGFGNNLAFGTSFNIYSISTSDIETSPAYDFSISALYFPNNLFGSKIVHNLRAGFQFQNVLGSHVKWSGYDSEPIFQTIRTGLSLRSSLNQYISSILVASDVITEGSEYDFEYWQVNFGIELELLHYLYFRYGRESKYSGNSSGYTELFPINRFGVGVAIPVNKVLGTHYALNIKFDLGRSDWNINESEYDEEVSQYNGIRRNIYSFQIQYQK